MKISQRMTGLGRLLMMGIFGLLVGACAPSTKDTAETYDYVLRNGLVYNGLGDSPLKADVAIKDGKFVKIGVIEGRGDVEIDATGKVVSPGWIDMMDQSGEVLLENGLAENKILMGVTTAFGGEGGTPVKAGEIEGYFKQLETQGIALNFGSYYNVFQARYEVLGEKNVDVTDNDIALMKQQVRTAMEEGVVGISSAAFYPPASFMTPHEIGELAKVAAASGGIYAAHIRDESRKLASAVDEMITIARASGIKTEIYHFKNAYAPHWDKEIHKVIGNIEQARAEGLKIGANQYPYIAGGTGLDATVPTWVFDDGEAAAFEKMKDPEIRARAKKDVNSPTSDRMVAASNGWQNVVLANAFSDTYKEYEGKNFVEIGKILNRDPADAAWDIMLNAYPQRAYALFFYANEKDLQTIMKRPWVSIGSDAAAANELGKVDALGLPHPRSYGTFPRIIAKYARDEGIFSLEEAIRKMTSLPASRMGLVSRGQITENFWADAVIFDYGKIQDRATWKDPLVTPSGIDYVFVNGKLAAEKGKHTGALSGQVLYGPGYKGDINR